MCINLATRNTILLECQRKLSMFNAHMRPSPFRHPLAVLRTMLGLSQEEFGKELVSDEKPNGLSRRTIQAIELGKLPLTPENALLIADKTGISVHWLMAGDPSTEPFYDEEEYDNRQPYTKEVFEQIRARIKAHEESGIEYVMPEATPAKLHVQAMAAALDWFPIFCAAHKAGKGDLAAYYMGEFLREKREQFGCDLGTAARINGRAKLIEAEGNHWAFTYGDGPASMTQIKGKSGIKVRRKPKVESPNKP
jgi:transcriptional regulator with XRE-family HTH domain